MSDGESNVADAELLARFILRKEWVRADGTLRPSALIPPPSGLSVTRHLLLFPNQLMEVGAAVAKKRGLEHLGRADLQTGAVRNHQLDVIPAPEEDNPNHAEIANWPVDKSAQTSKAQEMIRDKTVGQFIRKPYR